MHVNCVYMKIPFECPWALNFCQRLLGVESQILKSYKQETRGCHISSCFAPERKEEHVYIEERARPAEAKTDHFGLMH